MSSTTGRGGRNSGGRNSGGRNSGRRGGRGGRGGRGPAPRKESILELAKLMDATVRVKCIGGRELRGVLKGYDDLVNLVLDECDEYLRDPNDLEVVTENTRRLGLVVIRGTQVSLVCPEDGVEAIENPFVQAEEDEAEDG